MNISINNLARLSVFTLLTFAVAGTGTAAKCQPVDREQSISRVLERNPGSKVLKVVEGKGKDGCSRLKIRILIDGTVKAVTIKPKGT